MNGTATTTNYEYAAEILHASKRFGNAVQANDDVSFFLRPGEVHALLGENGAGKSTLVKTLYGMVQPDSGEIRIKGKTVTMRNSADAIANGIGMVHQELMLIPYMTVAENVMLGKEITSGAGRIDSKQANETIRSIATNYGFDIDPAIQVYKLPIGVQQRVEILKLLYRSADVLILDEPTALLTPQESTDLFKIVKALAAQGKSVVFITHKLDEVYEVADRMTVMRGGHVVASTTPAETNKAQLTELMIGKSVDMLVKQHHEISSEIILDVQGVSVDGIGTIKALKDISFSIHRGEVLGVAGIEGNGQTQLAEAIIGRKPVAGGKILYQGKDISNNKVRNIRSMGVASIPDDRQNLGLVLPFKISENLALNTYFKKPFANGPLFQNWKAIKTSANKVKESFDIRVNTVEQKVSALSGGNQQKVVVGRELTSDGLELIVAAQPTRGVDVASANYIHEKLQEAADNGAAILLISSDLDELLSMSDRIMVLSRGENVGIIDGADATKEKLGYMMLNANE